MSKRQKLKNLLFQSQVSLYLQEFSSVSLGYTEFIAGSLHNEPVLKLGVLYGKNLELSNRICLLLHSCHTKFCMDSESSNLCYCWIFRARTWNSDNDVTLDHSGNSGSDDNNNSATETLDLLRVNVCKNQRNPGHCSKFEFAHTLYIDRP